MGRVHQCGDPSFLAVRSSEIVRRLRLVFVGQRVFGRGDIKHDAQPQLRGARGGIRTRTIPKDPRGLRLPGTLGLGIFSALLNAYVQVTGPAASSSLAPCGGFRHVPCAFRARRDLWRHLPAAITLLDGRPPALQLAAVTRLGTL